MDLRKWAVDTNAEVKGVWREIDSDTELLIARHNNPRFRSIMSNGTLELGKRKQGSEATDDEADELVCRAMAKALLLGWRDPQNREGNTGMTNGEEYLAYSEDLAYDILRDPANHDFKELVLQMSMQTEHYRQERIKETVGN